MIRYATYEKFFNAEQAEPVLDILKDYEIPYEFAPINAPVDKIISGGGPGYSHEVKIPTNQFETANRILREKIQINLNEIDADYYLFTFDDNELIDILKEPDEWGRLDYVIAREIMETRGVRFSTEDLDAFWNKKMEKLAQPEKEAKAWLYAGYFFAVFGGFFGVLIGLVLSQSTKILPNGRRFYTYDEATRKRGKTILYLSLIVFAMTLTLKLTNAFVFFTNISLFPPPQINIK